MKDDFADNYTVRNWFREVRRMRKTGAAARWTRNVTIVAAVLFFMNGLISVRLQPEAWIWAGHFLIALGFLVAGLAYGRRRNKSTAANGGPAVPCRKLT